MVILIGGCMENDELIKLLFASREIEYIDFATKIINSKTPIIGVKTPIVKALAKKIVKESIDISNCKWHQYIESDLVIGLVHVYRKTDLKSKFDFIKEFMKEVDNWATVDQVACSLKTKEYTDSLKFIKECIASEFTFVRRFGYVFALANFMKEENQVIDILNLVKSDSEYYVEMAEAWLISVAYIYFSEITFEYLKSHRELSSFIINKSIAKIRESFRVDAKEKERVLALKKLN